MAKQQKNNEPLGFEIPTNSLAKVSGNDKEGSAAWMRKMAMEHGSTHEQKLEKRRKKISVVLWSMEKGLEGTQNQKKLFLADSAKQEKATLAAMEKTGISEEHVKLKQQLSQILGFREQQKTQYAMLIQQQLFQIATIELGCLQVDCMSIQMRTKSTRTGKKGTYRWSMAVYAMDAASEIARLYRRDRKVYEALLAHLGIRLDDSDPDDEGEEEEDLDDDDVVDEDDAKQLKKEVAGGDDDDYEAM